MFKKLSIFFFIIAANDFARSLPTPINEDLYGVPNTPENIEKLKTLGANEYAWLYSGQYEGDMVLSPEQRDILEGRNNGRIGVTNLAYRWPKGIVPILYADGEFNSTHKEEINKGFAAIAINTCIQFVPYDPNLHKNYILISSQVNACFSAVGMSYRGNGTQVINLALDGCIYADTATHEMMHALGFFHMQSSYDRDNYVKIIWENIEPGKERNFNIKYTNETDMFGVTYDYTSVMHYPDWAFSKNGQPTIIPLQPLNGFEMGGYPKASDYKRINKMYNCTSYLP